MKEYRLRSEVVCAGTRPSDGRDSVYLKVPAPHPKDAKGMIGEDCAGYIDLEVGRNDVNAWGKMLTREVDIIIRVPDEADALCDDSCGMCGTALDTPPPLVMRTDIYALGRKHLGILEVRSRLEGEARALFFEELALRLTNEAKEYRRFNRDWGGYESRCEVHDLPRRRCGCETT